MNIGLCSLQVKVAWVNAIEETLSDHSNRKETFERGRSTTSDGSGGAVHRESGHAAFAWQQRQEDESPDRDPDEWRRTAKLTKHTTTTVF